MNINYDKEADAIYLKFKSGPIIKTKKLNKDTLIDLNQNKEIIGLELLEVSKRPENKYLSKVHLRHT
jgi:uncharacterized protein YuzE